MSGMSVELQAGAVFLFSGKPSAAVRDVLKANGFQWCKGRNGNGGYWHHPNHAQGTDLVEVIREMLKNRHQS